MKTYSRHRCARQHRTAATFLRCAYPRAAWIRGTGPFAVIAWCDVTTVSLWRTEPEALDSAAFIDAYGCGHACTRSHEIVHINHHRKA